METTRKASKQSKASLVLAKRPSGLKDCFKPILSFLIPQIANFSSPASSAGTPTSLVVPKDKFLTPLASLARTLLTFRNAVVGTTAEKIPNVLDRVMPTVLVPLNNYIIRLNKNVMDFPFCRKFVQKTLKILLGVSEQISDFLWQCASSVFSTTTPPA